MPLLFSYGTLQQAIVQMSLFGRVLEGWPDELVGFEQSSIELDDEFAVENGEAQYSIVRMNGRSDSRVSGIVFEVSESELAKADAYEPPPYERISARLASGKQSWVYALPATPQ